MKKMMKSWWVESEGRWGWRAYTSLALGDNDWTIVWGDACVSDLAALDSLDLAIAGH